MGHATMEHRNGLAVAGLVTPASGTAERAASEELRGKNAGSFAKDANPGLPDGAR